MHSVPSRVSRLLHGKAKLKEEEVAWLADYLDVEKDALVAEQGGIFAVSVFKRELGWARIDPIGRLTWGRHKMSHYDSERKRVESGCRYLAQALRFEFPEKVLIEEPPGRRKKEVVIQKITKTAGQLAKTLGMATDQVPLHELKGGRGTKIVDLAPWLFRYHPELALSLELDRNSPAFAFNAKYWRAVFIALAIIHQNKNER